MNYAVRMTLFKYAVGSNEHFQTGENRTFGSRGKGGGGSVLKVVVCFVDRRRENADEGSLSSAGRVRAVVSDPAVKNS